MSRSILIKTRTMLVVLAVAVTTVLFAAPASANIDIYCDNCVVSTVPAVSATRYHYDNYMSVGNTGDLEIYFYNVSTGNTTCGKSVFSQYEVYRLCSNHATARCHTFGGTGQRVARCDAVY